MGNGEAHPCPLFLSDRKFDPVAFDPHDTAFIIPVAGRPRPADDPVTVRPEPLGEQIHGLPAPDAERDMDVSGPRGLLPIVRKPGPGHDFQPGPVFKRNEIGAKIRRPVVIAAVGFPPEIADKKISCPFQIRDIHRDMLDSHAPSRASL